ncbi:MAG: ATP-dependent DNA helicase RecG, partial [Oscillospiraceae bacterium]|nr:ATP-dependent DNA helicase RecG [Oscillospiraceae bacterium]
MATPDTNVRYIKGIGETRAKALEKLDIHTLRDLIAYFPRRYEDRRTIYSIAELPVGETACCRAMIADTPTQQRISGGRTVVKVRAVDETGRLDITFFNQDYRARQLKRGESYVFCGKVEGNLLRRQMTNPILEREGENALTGRIVPIYPLTAGINQPLLQKAVRQGLDACRDVLPDILPDEV